MTANKKTSVPYHKTRPELYRNGPFEGERAWYEECAGYSYKDRKWRHELSRDERLAREAEERSPQGGRHDG